MYSVTGRFLDDFEARFGPVARGLGRLTRPAIVAREGEKLVWGDWSAIEARVLPWLADSRGSNKVLDIFRRNDLDPSLPDIYKIEAGHIFDRDPADIDKGPERQTGKVTVLSLGFGGGKFALLKMAVGYGIHLSEAEAQRIVDIWRENNSWARTFWGRHNRNESYGLWGAACQALEDPGTIYPVGRVAFIMDPDYLGGTLFMSLPDGRLLTYPSIRWERRDVEDKQTGEVQERMVLTYSRGYGRRGLWHGVFAENATQATAGSLLRGKLVVLRSEEDWMPVTGHTHDEIVATTAEADAEEAEEVLQEVMAENDDWNPGLPLAVETTIHDYYTKAA